MRLGDQACRACGHNVGTSRLDFMILGAAIVVLILFHFATEIGGK
jgi:hypothetical protein